MKRARRLGFAIGLALAQGAWAVEDAPRASPPSTRRAQSIDFKRAAPDVEQPLPIAKAEQTIDFPKLWYAYYSPYDLSLYARASSDLQVVFSASDPCSIVGSSLRMAGLGECLVTADQPGDRNFNPAPSVKRSLPIIYQPGPP
jgi:hypothetical protein